MITRRKQNILKTEKDRYEIFEKIAEGGFGAVFKCRSLKTKLDYVIKKQNLSEDQKVYKQQ